MNLILTIIWMTGAVFWASADNAWLAALWALNAGLWLAAIIRDGI